MRAKSCFRYGIVGFAVMIAVAVATPSAFAAKTTTTKPYRAIVSSAAPVAGVVTFTVRLTNDASPQQLGSANVGVPSAFTSITAAIAAPASAAVRGQTVELRNMAIAPGASLDATITAVVPCASATYAWTVIAKQSNDFNGPPGNEFTLDSAGSSLLTTVSGSCRLAFVTTRQPAGAATNANITSVEFDPAGAPVQVAVIDDGGAVVTTSSAQITLAIGSGTAGAVLSGSLTRAASSGVATFSSLATDLHGTYTLAATSPGITSTTSLPFIIWDSVQSCAAGVPCTTTLTESHSMSAQATTTSSSSGRLLTSLGADAVIQCGEEDVYNHAPSVMTVDSRNLSSTKTITLTIEKSVVNSRPDNGVASYQVCYASDVAFADRFGATTNLGLLPDCVVTQPEAPCVLSKNKTKAGDMVIAILAPASDPKIW